MNSYWSQWDNVDLSEMQGIEDDTYDPKDDCDIDYDIEEESENPCCSGCLDCLGFSWGDFF